MILPATIKINFAFCIFIGASQIHSKCHGSIPLMEKTVSFTGFATYEEAIPT
jgi:hypothetical protein